MGYTYNSDGTINYTPENGNNTSRGDVFVSNQPVPVQPDLANPKFELFPVQQTGTRRVTGWRVTIQDLRGGLNSTFGFYANTATKFASSTLDTRAPYQLTLNQFWTAQATPDLIVNYIGNQMYAANVFGKLAIGSGGLVAGDKVLFCETNALDPTILDTGYEPGYGSGYQTSGKIWAVVMGGATGSPKLLISRNTSGAAGAQLLSNLTISSPTIAGTMHAKLDNLDAVIQTPTEDSKLLMMANGNLYSVSSSAAINTDPGTAVMTNLPTGAYELGLLSLNGPLRAYWVIPKGGVFTSDYAGVYSTQMDGTDLQELKFPLRTIYAAMVIRDGIVASDGSRIVFHNGKTVRDLLQLQDRVVDSDYITSPVSAWVVHNQDLYILMIRYSSTKVTEYWIESYDWDLGSWHQVSPTLTTTDMAIPLGSTDLTLGYRGYPYSRATKTLHTYFDGSWRQLHAIEPGVLPFSQRRSTGSSSSTGVKFATGGLVTLPEWVLPSPIDYCEKSTSRVLCLGNLDAGGSGSSVTVTVNGETYTFTPGMPSYAQKVDTYDTINRYHTLQVSIAITQGSDTQTTPQPLPIIIEGYAYLDEGNPPDLTE